MKKNKENTYYDAMGFAEALMAIMLVGVSSMVLLQIAINTLNNAMQNEVVDHMTQYAMEGAEMTQDLYNKHKIEQLTREDPEIHFPTVVPENDDNCFVIDKIEGEVSFRREDPDNPESFVRYSRDEDRNDYRHEAVLSLDEFGFEGEGGALVWTTSISDQFFRVVCLEGDMSQDDPFMIARVIVGQRYFDEELFGGDLYGNLVRDYEYITVINL
jgi:hypothetical protein